ncbi:hypothetical protein LX64_03340 [Chitinophaga skermanii]|uniref:DUF7660 domain-containing protein n=1 Tax=Chitinophaga skermanii TaxID=331697 RepID=A0A327QCP8_9BACT|nr:hypothetical protein [Chitinophaga skermanii]RAJ02329.1 hypothetical protein LX64_03340 [Chitinophaga skermanii]
MDVTDFIDRINNKEDFVKFLSLFINDFQTNIDSWENRSIEDFLYAMKAFLEASKPNSMHKIDMTPSWQLFAKVLIASSIYE